MYVTQALCSARVWRDAAEARTHAHTREFVRCEDVRDCRWHSNTFRTLKRAHRANNKSHWLTDTGRSAGLWCACVPRDRRDTQRAVGDTVARPAAAAASLARTHVACV